MTKSELVPKQVFNFVGYRFDLITGRVLPTQDRWETLQEKLRFMKSHHQCTVRQFMSLIGLLMATEKQVCAGRLHMRPIQWHLKKNWHVPEVLEKVIPVPQSLHPHLDWWLDEANVLRGQPLHPLQHAVQLFTDASNEGWGAHLGDFTARGVWSPLESLFHINVLELKAVLLALQQFKHLCKNQIVQHNSGLVHKQARGYEVRLSLCPPVETSVLVPSQGHNPTGQTHSRSLECDSRQTVQAQSSNPDRVVPLSTGVQSVVLRVGAPTGGFICDSVQSQTTQLILGASECIRLPSSRPASPGNLKVTGSGLSQNDSDCPRLTKHALVLGPGGPISADSIQSTSGKGPVDSTVQRAASQEPQESQSPCLAPRSSAIRKHGFSEEVAAQIEAPQRGSTRAVYKSKWAIFIKWCESNKVDFRSPSVNQIADFLLYLFKERNLQPSTIDGYRTAIADMVGNDTLNIGSDENLTRLLDSFHRGKRKGRRGVPSWNLSLVLHQLTKAPFEPLRKASLKYLTFKTVFLLALGSGKRRSEIHAWLFRNIRHQENWSQVSLYPSANFLAKNQLARDGPAAVTPVVIPALAPTLDKSLSEDRSLCPVRALRYYLNRTKDLRQGKDLVCYIYWTLY